MRPIQKMWVWALLGAGCIVEAPGGAPISGPRGMALKQAPALKVELKANLGNKVELVGLTVAPGKVWASESFKVTAEYKVLEAMDTDWTLFVHVEDSTSGAERLNVDHPPVNGTYPTTQWRPGETVQDEFTVTVPPGRSQRTLKLFMGFWDQRTDARLPLQNPQEVKNDGNHRILAAEIPVL